jgi:hypothetical protein
MANEPLPEPYAEIRSLHREYARRHAEIWGDESKSRETRQGESLHVWFETNERLKQLRKGLPKKQQCKAMTRSGVRCTRLAMPDFIGQLCSSHAPHVNDW